MVSQTSISPKNGWGHTESVERAFYTRSWCGMDSRSRLRSSTRTAWTERVRSHFFFYRLDWKLYYTPFTANLRFPIFRSSWLDPAENVKVRHQISDLLATLHCESVPDITAMECPETEEETQRFTCMFLMTALLARELSLRLRADSSENWHGGMTVKIFNNMVVSERFASNTEPVVIGQEAFSFCPLSQTEEVQLAGLLHFAQAMDWPYLTALREALESIKRDNIGPPDPRLKRAASHWITGSCAPGSNFVLLIMAILLDCVGEKEKFEWPGFFYHDPNAGVLVPVHSYWRARGVLAKVLVPLDGIHMMAGWVGPCPPVCHSCSTLEYGGVVYVKARDTDISIQTHSGGNEEEDKAGTDREYPQVPPISEQRSTFSLKAIRLNEVPRDVSAAEDTWQPEFHASVEFQVISSDDEDNDNDNDNNGKQSIISFPLYTNPLFVEPPRCCKGPHYVDSTQAHLYRRTVVEPLDLDTTEVDRSVITVINATASTVGAIMARAWCAARGINAVVLQRRTKSGCCYKCGLMMAGRVGLGVGVLILS